jgi:hypothetical protein
VEKSKVTDNEDEISGLRVHFLASLGITDKGETPEDETLWNKAFDYIS